MKDFITAKERLSNPHKKWISKDFKESLIILMCSIAFVILLTNPSGVI